MIVFVRALGIAALCFFAGFASPAVALSVLQRPDLDLAAAGFVVALARQPDGGTVVAGQFTSIGGLAHAGFARLRPDGTPDPIWAPSFSGSQNIAALAVDADGDIYASGWFGVVKMSSAGVVDATFQSHSTGTVEFLALDGNGHVYAAGNSLSQISGRPAAGIARLDAETGASDASWTLSAPVNRSIFAIAADADALYVGGVFENIGGQARRNLARLTNTGSVDTTWNTSPDGYVRSLAVDGASLYVGGDFYTIGTQAMQKLARVSRSGAGNADTTWRPVSDGGVTQLAFDGAGQVYASSYLNTPDTTLHRIRRFSVVTAAVDPDWAPAPSHAVHALAAGSTGAVAGGDFDRMSQHPRFGLAAFGADGTLLPAANPERAALILAVAQHPAGGMIIGGDFNRVDGFERRHLARLTATGEVDPTWDPSPNGGVQTLAVDSAGRVYASGLFDVVGGLKRWYLARITNAGTVDPDWNPLPNSIVRAIEFDGDGSVYLGGAFTSVAGAMRSKIAKLRHDDMLDPAWNPGIDGEVQALELDGHGALFAGGDFAHAGGLERKSLVKLRTTDGVVDATWNVPVDGFVGALAADTDGALYVGGYFATIAGAARGSLAKVGANGAVDAWNPLADGGQSMSSSMVRAVVFDEGGNVWAGGWMMLAPSNFAGCARFSAGTGAVDDGWSLPTNNEVRTLATGADGTMIAGGFFTMIGGTRRDGLAVIAAGDMIFADGFEQD